jgi:hypothetical protein
VFALVEGVRAGRALADSIRATFGHRLARVELSRARNRGASCDISP